MAIIIAVLVIIALPYVIAACMGTFLFWYEAANNPCKELDTPKPGFLLCGGMLLRTLAGYVMAIACHPLGWLPRKKPTPWQPDGSLSHPPVVLIHGIYHNPSAWILVEKRLEKAGYVVSNFAYHSFFVPVDSIVRQLDDHLHLLEASHPGQKPILIGHSMGGLMIRKWLMDDPKNQERINGVLTLATPHGGSKLAALAPGNLVRTIAPAGSLIKELEKALPISGPMCVSMASPVDEIVLPSEHLLPPEGWALRVTENASHFGILLRSNIITQIIEELGRMEKAVGSTAPAPGAERPKASKTRKKASAE